jgi:hypothetical protein
MVFYFDCKKRIKEIMCSTNNMSSNTAEVINRANLIQPPVRSKSMSHDTRKKFRSRCRRIAVALRGVLFIYLAAPVVLPTFADAKILYISTNFHSTLAKYFCNRVSEINFAVRLNFGLLCW